VARDVAAAGLKIPLGDMAEHEFYFGFEAGCSYLACYCRERICRVRGRGVDLDSIDVRFAVFRTAWGTTSRIRESQDSTRYFPCR
jgi:hypothetical protein